MKNRIDKISVLVSCFACGPNWGSEVGMGWNWVISLSEHCQLTVITEKGFQKEIEEALPGLALNNVPIFHYIDIGEKGRNLFWKQGSFKFYHSYNQWQKQAFEKAEALLASQCFDVVHQLNLIGFREPGYLWKLDNKIPFVWGPVGGFNQVPLRYMTHFDLKNLAFYLGKAVLHNFQVHFKQRVQKAFQKTDLVFAESSITKKVLKQKYNIDAVLMNETGGDFQEFYSHNSFCGNGSINILWVGKIQGLKALPIAFKAVAMAGKNVPIKLTVVGDGPDEALAKNLVEKLGIQDMVSFTGKIPNAEVKKLMRISDVLLFTSLKEGTPHVVLEALSNGLPVLCHDACGHGDIVNEQTGIKVPMQSHQKSVIAFAKNIELLFNHQEMLAQFSKNAEECVRQNSWENKALTVVKYYQQLIGQNKVLNLEEKNSKTKLVL